MYLVGIGAGALVLATMEYLRKKRGGYFISRALLVYECGFLENDVYSRSYDERDQCAVIPICKLASGERHRFLNLLSGRPRRQGRFVRFVAHRLEYNAAMWPQHFRPQSPGYFSKTPNQNVVQAVSWIAENTSGKWSVRAGLGHDTHGFINKLYYLMSFEKYTDFLAFQLRWSDTDMTTP